MQNNEPDNQLYLVFMYEVEHWLYVPYIPITSNSFNSIL